MEICYFEKISQNLVSRQHAQANDHGKMFRMGSVHLIIIPFYKLEKFWLATELYVKEMWDILFGKVVYVPALPPPLKLKVVELQQVKDGMRSWYILGNLLCWWRRCCLRDPTTIVHFGASTENVSATHRQIGQTWRREILNICWEW